MNTLAKIRHLVYEQKWSTAFALCQNDSVAKEYVLAHAAQHEAVFDTVGPRHADFRLRCGNGYRFDPELASPETSYRLGGGVGVGGNNPYNGGGYGAGFDAFFALETEGVVKEGFADGDGSGNNEGCEWYGKTFSSDGLGNGEADWQDITLENGDGCGDPLHIFYRYRSPQNLMVLPRRSEESNHE